MLVRLQPVNYEECDQRRKEAGEEVSCSCHPRTNTVMPLLGPIRLIGCSTPAQAFAAGSTALEAIDGGGMPRRLHGRRSTLRHDYHVSNTESVKEGGPWPAEGTTGEVEEAFVDGETGEAANVLKTTNAELSTEGVDSK